MTVPALPGDDQQPARALPDCEPGAPARRWSTPVRRTTLRLVPPPPPPLRPRLPPPAVARVLRQVVEAMDGRRPIEQLQSLLTRAAFADLLAWLRAVSPGSRYTLRSIHTCRPTAAVVEASVVVDHRSPTGPRRAVAAVARFEREGERWRCTVLVLL